VRRGEGLTREGKRLTDNGRNVSAEHLRWTLSGPKRALLYRFTMETALRRGAIERLTIDNLDLGDERSVTVSSPRATRRISGL